LEYSTKKHRLYYVMTNKRGCCWTRNLIFR